MENNKNWFTDPVEINNNLGALYAFLYTSAVSYDTQSCSSFLNPLQHLLNPQEDCIDLSAPLSLSKLHKALLSMNKRKSPGLHSLPPEFYLTSWPQVGPLLLDMILSAISKSSISKNNNTTTIYLLLEKDKDPQDCSNYGPLLFLNTDIKL